MCMCVSETISILRSDFMTRTDPEGLPIDRSDKSSSTPCPRRKTDYLNLIGTCPIYGRDSIDARVSCLDSSLFFLRRPRRVGVLAETYWGCLNLISARIMAYSVSAIRKQVLLGSVYYLPYHLRGCMMNEIGRSFPRDRFMMLA
jgi:hypothetical protein